MQWRVGEISASTQPGTERHSELKPAWISAELAPFNPALRLPINLTHPGSTYRVRVRMKDNTGRYSRWSELVKFTATLPAGAPAR